MNTGSSNWSAVSFLYSRAWMGAWDVPEERDQGGLRARARSLLCAFVAAFMLYAFMYWSHDC